jgi:hypothetical protein
MRHVTCWNDLRPFGLDCLTGEACGLMYRILFDCTERGRKIVAKCFGIPDLTLAEAWNRGSKDEPHVGSIMLSQEMLVPLGVFALLESGCTEAWIVNGGVIGVEKGDDADQIQQSRQWHKPSRALRYAGTAGDRNLHVMSGRVT